MKWLLITLSLLITHIASAHNNRYIYIQGDKQVGFVVAVEGYNLPKLGTHFCIIPNLEPGIAHITITFQSSEYPVHKFKIKVPEHSSRGLILTKVTENTYALFDMQTQAYISKDNTEDEAFLAFNPEEFSSLVKKNNSNNNNIETVHISERNKNQNKPQLVKPQENKTTDKPVKNEFLEDIDLNKSKNKPKNKDNNREKNNNKNNDNNSTTSTSNSITPYEGDCQYASSTIEFERFSARYVNQKDDTEKLKYIRKNKNKICLNTSQILILSNFLEGQSSKFELFDMLKNDVIDRENFPNLQKVFNSDFMKEKFVNMIK